MQTKTKSINYRIKEEEKCDIKIVLKRVSELISAQPQGMALHSRATRQFNRAAAALEIGRGCS